MGSSSLFDPSAPPTLHVLIHALGALHMGDSGWQWDGLPARMTAIEPEVLTAIDRHLAVNDHTLE